ncbi:MAG: D-aminoacyl-tRNA deacylase [Cyanobacteria bacterium P01_A01_bin.105]
MRILLQRVTASHVSVDGQVVGKIGRGLTLLVGIARTDTPAEVGWLVNKCLTLRLFPQGPAGRFEASVQDIQGELLVVSQFTLYGNGQKGRRLSFDQAAPPAQALPLYDAFVRQLRQSGLTVATGQFGAHMAVSIDNDGPVTLLLERDAAVNPSV